MGFAKISISEVKLGMYIRLPLNWLKHPFMRNSFSLNSYTDLKLLQELGISAVEYDPERSAPEDGGRAISSQASSPPGKEGEQQDLGHEAIIARKKMRDQFLKQRRKKIVKLEEDYGQAFSSVAHIMKAIATEIEEGLKSARQFMDRVVDSLLQDEETMVHLLNLKEKDDIAYFHSLNVCILSLILGKKLGLSKPELDELGMGSLFHDIGKQKIPKKILLKNSPLTRAEREYLQLHPRYGVELLAGAQISPRVLEIVSQHHEKGNGKGYPRNLTEYQISYSAKIVAVANVYDNLSNHTAEGRSLTPHETLSYMYTQLSRELSPEIISAFIKSLGVYPPGTLVELSDGSMGMVITTDKAKSLRPTIVLYDETVPREEPLIINLAEEDLNIVRSLRPAEVDPAVLAYLQPGRMIGFFVGSFNSPKKTS